MSGGKRWLVGGVVVLAVSVLATGGLVVCLSLARRQGEGSVAGSRIAFLSDREGDLAFYVTTADGSEVRRVSGLGVLVRGPSWSPDGQRLAYLAPNADDETRIEVHVVPVDEAEGAGDEVVAGFEVEEGDISAPVWSPDGAVLAVAIGEGRGEGGELQSTLYFLGVGAGGAVVERTLVIPGAVSSLQWSPSGDALLIVGTRYGPREDSASYQVDLLAEDGGELTTLWPNALTADWSPDGAEIVVGDWESSLVVILGRDGAPRQGFELPDRPWSVAWSPDGARIAVLTAGAHSESFGLGNTLRLIAVESGGVATAVDSLGQRWLAVPSWSADGTRLTFTWGEFRVRSDSPLDVYAGLWVYDCVSDRMESVGGGAGFDGLGAWSP